MNYPDLPEDANIVSSHSIFKINKSYKGNMKLKGRTVVHGNPDADNDGIIADCAASYMAFIIMVLDIVT